MDTKRTNHALNEKSKVSCTKDTPLGFRRGRGILNGKNPTRFRHYIAETFQEEYGVRGKAADLSNSKESPKGKLIIQSVKSYQKPRQVTKICIRCNQPFIVPAAHQERRKHCSVTCCALDRRLFEVTTEELYALVWSRPTTEVAQMFGVSDKAIEKRCKLLGVPKPPRGYWLQIYRLQKKTA